MDIKRVENVSGRLALALFAAGLSMAASAALRPAELVDIGSGYMQPETVNVVNGAQVFYKGCYQYFSEKYQTTDWSVLEGVIPYGMWDGYVVTEVNSVLEDGDIANFKVPSMYYSKNEGDYEASNWWDPVVGIDSDLMRGRAIRGLLLSDRMIFVGDRAFESCHELRYVGFGAAVTNLGERVFADCIALDHVHLPTNAWLGVAAFSNCVSLTDVVLPRNPTAIPDCCFMDCAALTRIALPNAVERIGAGAFAHTGLEKLTMPTNLVEIQDGAFSGCTNLSAALFFENLTTIASNAFAGCSRLTKLVFLGKAPTVEGGALDGVPSNAIVYVTDRWDGPRDRWCGLEVRMYEARPSLMQFDLGEPGATIYCYPDFHCGELPAIPLCYRETSYNLYFGNKYGWRYVADSWFEPSFDAWRYVDGSQPTAFDIIVSDTNAVSSSFVEGGRRTVVFELTDCTGDYMNWGIRFYDTVGNTRYGDFRGVSDEVELWCDRLTELSDVWAGEPTPSVFVGWNVDFADIAQSPTNLSVHAVYRWKTAGESFNESGLSRYVLDAEALAVDGIVQFSGVIELDDPAAKLYDVGVWRYQTPERLFENLNLQLVGVSDDGRERKVLKTMPLMMVVSQMFHDYYYTGNHPYETDPIVDRWVMQIPQSDIDGCMYFELQLVSGALSYYWPYDEAVTGDVYTPEWSNTHLWASLVDCGDQATVHEIDGSNWDFDVFAHVRCGDVLKIVGGGDLNLSTFENYDDWYCGLLDNPYQYDRLHRRLGQWLSYGYGSYSLPVYYVRIPDADSWKWDYCSGYGGTYSDQESFHNEWSDFYWDDGAWSKIRWDRVWDDYYSYHYISPQLQSEQITIQTSTSYPSWGDYGRNPVQFKILLPGTDIIYYDLGRYGRLTNSTPEYVVDSDGQKCLCDEGERPVLGDEDLTQVVYWRLAAPEGIDWRGWRLDPIPAPDVSTNDDFQVAAGWTFVGWSKDPSEAGNKDVLVAQYKLTEYRLAYENTKGAQNSNPTNFTMADEIEFAELPDVPGWAFAGWSPQSIRAGTIGDVTVTAEWELVSNAVVFVEGAHGRRCGGGELRQSVAYGACAVAPSVAPDPGWRFVGWGGDVAQPITNATVFTAQYEPVVYGIRYENTQGAANGNPLTYTVEDAVTFAALPDLPTLRFTGWSPAGIVRGTTGDVVASAVWSRIAATVYGSGGDARTWYVGDTYEREIETPVVNGGTQRVLVAWSAWNKADANVVASGTNSTVRFELGNAGPYGVSETWRTNYWLGVDVSGNGRIVGAESGWLPADSEVGLSAVPDEGLYFAGWTGDTDGCAISDDGSALAVPMTKARQVGAAFAHITHRVTFDLGAHGARTGGGALEQSVVYGSAAVAPTVAPAAGWRFDGWDGAFADVRGDLTVTARYSIVSYRIEYVNAQGVAHCNPLTYTVEDAVTFDELPDLPTFRFAGWSPAGIVRGTTGDIVATANWSQIEHQAPWSEDDIVAQADTMIIYAVISNRQARAYVEADGSLLAAFAANGELRGVTEIYHSDTRGWRYQLSVGVTSVEEKDITLKVWDASTGRITDVIETVDCNPDMQIGTFKDPHAYLIGSVESKILLREGWNWISPAVSPDEPTVGEVMSGIAFAEDDVIKSSDKTATFCDGQWNPSTFRIEPGAAYMISKSAGGAEELVFTGGDASPEVGVRSGWNWLGATVLTTQRISSVTHSVGFAEDDVFKSVSRLTTYCDDAWQPSSYEVVPGAGYKARFANAGTLSFAPQAFADALPAKGTLLAVGRLLRSSGADRAPWSPDDIVRQEDTMVVYLRVSNVVQKTSFDADGSVVAAFAKNGECRGCTAIEDGPRGKLYQLSVGVASAYEDGFTLKLWDAASGKVYELEGELACNADKKIGAYKQPYVMYVVAEQPIPPLPVNPTAEDVRKALEGSSDIRLQERITDPEEYGTYRAWAETVKAPGSQTAAGAQAVKDSPNAWLSFALDSATLIPAPLADGDVKVDRFVRTATAGVFDFTVSIKDVLVGDAAMQGNLSKVFGIEGGTALDAMSSENVNLTFDPPENGKVRFKAGPKDEKAPAFFMKVKVLP